MLVAEEEPDDGIGVVDVELRRYGVRPEVVLPVVGAGVEVMLERR